MATTPDPRSAGDQPKDFIISRWALELIGDPTTAKLLDKLTYLSTKLAKSNGLFYRSKKKLLRDIEIETNKSTLTRRLDVLEESGFIRQIPNPGYANDFRVEWQAIREACMAKGITWDPQSVLASEPAGDANQVGETSHTDMANPPRQSGDQYDLQREHLRKEPRHTPVAIDSEPLRGSWGGSSEVLSKEEVPNSPPAKNKTGEKKGRERTDTRIADGPPPAPDPGQSGEDRSYDWKHYAAIPVEAWKRAEEGGVLPPRESRPSLILGSYVLGMWENNHINVPLDAGDFNRKPGKNAKDCLAFFRKKNGGDEAAGFREALEWIRWYTAQPTDSYQGEAAWSMELCFTKSQYRKFEALSLAQRQQKTKGLKRNDAVGMVRTVEEGKESAWTRF